MWATPTQQDSRIGPDNIGGSAHRAARGSVALADQILFGNSPSSGISDPGDTVNRVHRLKALGNGIVPACAYPFAVAIYRQLERES